MVMANTPETDAPSAQNVGSEFVRQYYTLLNEAPYHLHRFYSQNSTFIHGGVEKPGETVPPVMGQQDIHNRIIGLNFKDCHAKIRQVDASPTVGHGVVIQVTGELSNNGQPMRRFMQTFVLGLQAAKQYYVHNDIFRYQDEVFSDEEEVEGEDLEQTTDAVENGAPVETPQAPDAGLFFEQQPLAVSNGTVQEEEVEAAPVVAEQPKVSEVQELEPDIDSLDIEEEQPEAQPIEAQSEPEPEPQPAEPAKPFSWAALASKNTNAAVQPTPTFASTSHLKTRAAEPKGEAAQAAASAPAGNPQPQRARVPREGRYERDRSNMSRGEEGDGDSNPMRRPGGGVGIKHPDSHQLFVGNLPHNISERELKVFFEHWGRVLELRINTKSSGGKLPNFGFVVFEGPEPVQEVLKQKPIKFNGEHRLNVEEKKPRGSEGRPSGRGAPRGGGPGGPTRGGFGGRGGMKGGGGYGRGGDGERRGGGGGMGMGGGQRGGMSGPPRR